jgi:serine/threonine-protein kinase
MDTPQTGDVLLGKYRIEQVLGKGGMGIVVAARHVELGQRYAIKFLLPTVLSQEEAVERFLREARASARLQSEHVARVHDVGHMDNGSPYMVMEYLEGCDLKALVSKEGPLPADVAITYLAHVCDAIAEAHAAGIIHRDLKPANLFLVRRRNGSPCVKVLDFGISKHIGTNEVDLTATNATLGSPLYMSPEQISKSKTVDTRTDIWALGVILYELLTSTSPFRGGTALEVVSRILQEEPIPIRQLRPDVPERAEVVITRCLRKRREERFQTVEEVLAILENGTLTPHSVPLSATSTAGVATTNSTPGMVSITNETSGQPTTVAFGQTQNTSTRQSPNPVILAMAAGATVVILGGIGFGLREFVFSKQDPTPAVTTSPGIAEIAPSTAIVVAPAPKPDPTVEPIQNTAPAASVSSTAPEKAKPLATTAPSPNHDSGSTPTIKKKRSAL